MTDLQIVIPCGVNSSKYLEFLVDSIVKNTPKFKLLIGVKNKCLPKATIKSVESKVKDVEFIDVDCKFGTTSAGHGFMLDTLCKNLECEYTCFFDCDTALLHPDWFNILSKELKGDNICIGSEYDGKKYYNFPNVIFCLFKTKEFKSLGISFAPGGNHIVTEEDYNIFGRKKGDEIFLDVGWEFPYKTLKAGYNGISLPLISPRIPETVKDLKFMEPDMRGEEHQYKSIPIVTHVGRSSSRQFEDPIVTRWVERVNQWADQMDT